MCITKNEMLNDISTNLVTYLDKEQVDMVKAVFMIKMQGYDIHAVDTAPAVQALDIDAMYRRTCSVKYVSILLGHASTAITEKYYLVDDLKDVEYQALREV